MKYVMTIVWAVIFGFVVCFIGSALTQTTRDFTQAAYISAIFGLLLGIVPAILGSEKTNTKQSK